MGGDLVGGRCVVRIHTLPSLSLDLVACKDGDIDVEIGGCVCGECGGCCGAELWVLSDALEVCD